MSKTIIWDFNGTIINDVDLAVDILNSLYKIHHIDKCVGKKEYKEIFDFPVIDYYRNAGFDLNEQTFQCISKEYIALYKEGFKHVKVSDDVITLLKKYQLKGYKNVIISASQHDMLVEQINSLGLNEYFDEIVGIDDIYATSKVDIAKRWASKHTGPFVFIGDTAHDYEVAKEIGATCYLLSDGHFSQDRLLKLTDKVYPSIREVEKCLE